MSQSPWPSLMHSAMSVADRLLDIRLRQHACTALAPRVLSPPANAPRRFVVIDLKIEDFKPEFAGKMNFYLNAVDALERQPEDEPSIGLVLCPGRNKTVTEWALRGVDA